MPETPRYLLGIDVSSPHDSIQIEDILSKLDPSVTIVDIRHWCKFDITLFRVIWLASNWGWAQTLRMKMWFDGVECIFRVEVWDNNCRVPVALDEVECLHVSKSADRELVKSNKRCVAHPSCCYQTAQTSPPFIQITPMHSTAGNRAESLDWILHNHALKPPCCKSPGVAQFLCGSQSRWCKKLKSDWKPAIFWVPVSRYPRPRQEYAAPSRKSSAGLRSVFSIYFPISRLICSPFISLFYLAIISLQLL